MTYPTPGQPPGSPQPYPVWIIDNNGNPVSIGGGTQYIDGGTPPANPIGNALVFDNSGTWADVGVDHPLPITGSISATNPSVGTDSAAVPGSETLIGAKDGSGNLKPVQTDGTNVLVKDTNSAAIKSDLDTINTNTTTSATQNTTTATNTTTLAGVVSGNKAAVKAATGDVVDLATLAGIVSSNKAAVKAATGDIVDLATIAAAIVGSIMQDNIKQLNGTTISVNAGNRDAGTQRTTQAGNGTAAITQVASSATSGQLLAANTNKTGTSFFNDSTQILYLLYGSGTASTTNYSVQVPAKTLYEDPFHFTGVFTGIWAAANGNVYCTEVS